MFFSKKKKEVSLDVADPRNAEGHCFISGNVHINGEVQFAGTLRVDGRIDGRVSVYDGKRGTLIISKGAFINGPVVTTDLITDGSIHGDVLVENRLECRSAAVIRGDVQYGSLSLADGAHLMGRCIQKQAFGRYKDVGTGESVPSLATRDLSYLRKSQ